MLPSLAMKLYECFLQWDPAAQLLCVLISGVLPTFSMFLIHLLKKTKNKKPKLFQEHVNKGCAAAHTDRMQ